MTFSLICLPVFRESKGQGEAMKKTFLGVTAAVLLGANGAAAQSGVFDWSGFYIGANVGYGGLIARDTVTTDLGGVPGGPLDLRGKDSGFVAGTRFALNYQASRIVYGIDGSWSFGNMRAETACGNAFALFGLAGADCRQNDRLNDVIDLRGRLGIAADRVLLYFAGGIAAARFRSTLQPDGALLGVGGFGDATFNKTATGWTVGAGFEYALSRNWVIGAEYKYYDFGSVSGSSVAYTGAPVTTVFNTAKLTESIVLFSLSYKLGNW